LGFFKSHLLRRCDFYFGDNDWYMHKDDWFKKKILKANKIENSEHEMYKDKIVVNMIYGELIKEINVS